MTNQKLPEWTDDDVVNPDDFDNVRGIWLIHDHGFTVCVVLADTLQDALDEAADRDKLDRWKLSPEQVEEYEADETRAESISFLGNHGEPHDIEGAQAIEIDIPKFSLKALFTLTEKGAEEKS